jgi:hypothetical protein
MDPTAKLLRELAADYRALAKGECAPNRANALIEVAEEIEANAARLEKSPVNWPPAASRY